MYADSIKGGQDPQSQSPPRYSDPFQEEIEKLNMNDDLFRYSLTQLNEDMKAIDNSGENDAISAMPSHNGGQNFQKSKYD